MKFLHSIAPVQLPAKFSEKRNWGARKIGVEVARPEWVRSGAEFLERGQQASSTPAIVWGALCAPLVRARGGSLLDKLLSHILSPPVGLSCST